MYFLLQFPYIVKKLVHYVVSVYINEDDFSYLCFDFLVSNKLFSNYKFKIKQRKAVNGQLLFVSMFLCNHANESVAEIMKLKLKVVFIVLIFTRTTVFFINV